MYAELPRVSPVEQDFIWLGEYYDGTHLAEFDFYTKEENSFYDIDRKRLMRFGLIGHGMKLAAESDGIFYLNGYYLDILYRTDEKEYHLTGRQGMLKDIIAYKDAESTFRPNGGVSKTMINQYNFGYKTTLKVDDVTFNLRALCKVPFNHPVYMSVRLVADTDLNGRLVLRKHDGSEVEVEAPLRKGVGGEFNWVVR